MKIHSIHNQRSGRQVNRLLAICGVALLGFTMPSVAQAQEGFLDRLTAGNGFDTSQSLSAGSGRVKVGNEAFRVVKSSAVRTAADRGERGAVRQTAMLSCGSCGNSCGGACSSGSCSSGSCGASCGGACGGGYSAYSLGSYGDACGIPCKPYCYAIIEGLYISREGKERVSLGPNISFGGDGFDLEEAGRITIGRVPDCVHGCEITFTGNLQWDRSGSITGSGISEALIPGDPVPASDLSSFDNADFQSLAYQAEYYSIEANRTLVGWDVSKILYGLRYIDYDEELRYSSTVNNQPGLLFSKTENQLFGLQGGLDLLYPICEFGYVDFRGRAGLFANFVESGVVLTNNNSLVLANNDDTTDITGLIEFGSGLRYQLGEMLSIRAGGEMWYIFDLAAAPDQIGNGVVTPTLGRSARVKDDVFFIGLNAGIELRY